MTTSTPVFGHVEFGQNLRRLRLERALTQEELAESAGVSSRYVALIEAGARNPTLAVVFELASALQIPPSKLFKPAL
jgi:transcriptional regulator with XRE-family HTH domain